MDINNAYVRDAILYFTIQQYFNCNDKKTSQFIAQLDHLLILAITRIREGFLSYLSKSQGEF